MKRLNSVLTVEELQARDKEKVSTERGGESQL